jgi:hypothetical protein
MAHETLNDWARRHGLSTEPAPPSVRAGEPVPIVADPSVAEAVAGIRREMIALGCDLSHLSDDEIADDSIRLQAAYRDAGVTVGEAGHAFHEWLQAATARPERR